MGMKNHLLDALWALWALLDALCKFGKKCYISSSGMAVVCKNLAIVFLTGGAIAVGYHVYVYCSIEPPSNHRKASENFPAKIDRRLRMKSVNVMEVLCEPRGIENGFDKDATKMLEWCGGACPMIVPSHIGHAFAMCSDLVDKEDENAFLFNSPGDIEIKQEWDEDKFDDTRCDTEMRSFILDRNKVADTMIRDGFVDHFNTTISETNWNESIELGRMYLTTPLHALSPAKARRVARHLKICAYSYKNYHQTQTDRSQPLSATAISYGVKVVIMFLLYKLPRNGWGSAMTALVLLYMLFTTYTFCEFKFAHKGLITVFSIALLLYTLFKKVEIERD